MKIFITLIFGVLILVGIVRYIEATSIFFPDKNLVMTPKDARLPFHDVMFRSSDGIMLHGWFIEGRPENGILLFLHGNAGNISHRLEKIAMFHELGLSVFIIDYRGYGKSEGRPTEGGIYRDAQAAFDYLVNEKGFPAKKIIAYGASLGGAVAVDLASKRKVSSVIIDSSFSNAIDVAKSIYPFVPMAVLKTGILKTKLDSLAKIKKIGAPKLFFHSQQDEIIPVALGRKLYEAAAEPKTFVLINGGHNDAHLHDAGAFMSAINNFLTEQNLIL